MPPLLLLLLTTLAGTLLLSLQSVHGFAIQINSQALNTVRRMDGCRFAATTANDNDNYDAPIDLDMDFEDHYKKHPSETTVDQSTHQDPFASLGLSPEVLSAVRAQSHWTQPTPIQKLAIPAILGHNPTTTTTEETPSDETTTTTTIPTPQHETFWCEAPTGSGKTAAFALPLLDKLNRRGNTGIASVVLCPTRELAVQIGHVFSKLTHNLAGKKRWKVSVIHGGVPLEPQIVDLANAVKRKQTVDVLVATPGRLVDVLTYYNDDTEGVITDAALERRLLDAMDQQGKLDASLNLEQIQELELDRVDDDGRESVGRLLDNVQYLVIDEADRLLGRGFESEMNDCLDLLLGEHETSIPTNMDTDDDGTELSKTIPTWLFSATFPKQIEPRVDQVLKRLHPQPALRISCSASDRVQDNETSASLEKRLQNHNPYMTVEQVGPASTLDLQVVRLEQPKRTLALRKLLEDHPEWDRVLVFVATRYASEHVSRKLRRVGIASAELHGKLDQEARLRRLRAFANGRTRVLLATDVASRGLDVVGLPVVVNYDLPRSTGDFVHRVGRTGRAGKPGTAVSFLTPSSEAHLELIEQRHLAAPMKRITLEGLEPDEDEWAVQSAASRTGAPGTEHSTKGLAHDKMYGGVKGRRKSKKDRLREQAARAAAGSAGTKKTR